MLHTMTNKERIKYQLEVIQAINHLSNIPTLEAEADIEVLLQQATSLLEKAIDKLEVKR